MPLAQFEKLNGDPKDSRGKIKDGEGRDVLDASGQPVVVSYQEYRDLTANPGKHEQFVKDCAKRKSFSIPDAPAEARPDAEACPACSALNSPLAIFCSSCGVRLAEAKAAGGTEDPEKGGEAAPPPVKRTASRPRAKAAK